MTPIRIALVGLGEIAGKQHLPAIRASDSFLLQASVSPGHVGIAGTPHFERLEDLLREGPEIDAISLCTPPQVRHALAARAILAGKHVFLEKPPGTTLAEVAALEGMAQSTGVTVLTSWHSRFAGGVEPARAWLADRRIERVSIIWREDVRVWHPGQDWIWQHGGLGVFDPGINALSIATHIFPGEWKLLEAHLDVPENCAMPIAADLHLEGQQGYPITMNLDFRQTGPQSWDIIVQTDAGLLKLSNGGAMLTLPNGTQHHEDREYSGLYAHFARLVHEGASDVNVEPLRLVQQALACGQRTIVAPFMD